MVIEARVLSRAWENVPRLLQIGQAVIWSLILIGIAYLLPATLKASHPEHEPPYWLQSVSEEVISMSIVLLVGTPAFQLAVSALADPIAYIFTAHPKLSWEMFRLRIEVLISSRRRRRRLRSMEKKIMGQIETLEYLIARMEKFQLDHPEEAEEKGVVKDLEEARVSYARLHEMLSETHESISREIHPSKGGKATPDNTVLRSETLLKDFKKAKANERKNLRKYLVFQEFATPVAQDEKSKE